MQSEARSPSATSAAVSKTNWTDVGIQELIVFSLKATVALVASSLILAAGGLVVVLAGKVLMAH